MCHIDGKRVSRKGEKVEIDPSTSSGVFTGYQNIIHIDPNVYSSSCTAYLVSVTKDTAIGERLAAIISGLNQIICV